MPQCASPAKLFLQSSVFPETLGRTDRVSRHGQREQKHFTQSLDRHSHSQNRPIPLSPAPPFSPPILTAHSRPPFSTPIFGCGANRHGQPVRHSNSSAPRHREPSPYDRSRPGRMPPILAANRAQVRNFFVGDRDHDGLSSRIFRCRFTHARSQSIPKRPPLAGERRSLADRGECRVGEISGQSPPIPAPIPVAIPVPIANATWKSVIRRRRSNPSLAIKCSSESAIAARANARPQRGVSCRMPIRLSPASLADRTNPSCRAAGRVRLPAVAPVKAGKRVYPAKIVALFRSGGLNAFFSAI